MLKQTHAIRNTFGYYSLFACIGLNMGIIGPTIPSLASQTGSSIAAIGGIFLVGPLGATVGTFVAGKLLDRISRGHLILGLSQLMSALMIFLIPLSPFYWTLLFANVLIGFTNGFINAGANTLIMWTHGGKSAPFINGLHFFFGLGAFGAPFLFAILNSHGGNYREAYWILAFFSLLSAIFVLFLGDCPRSEQMDDNSSVQISIKPYLPVIIAAMLYLFFYVGSEITYGGWIFTYLTKMKIADDTQGAYLTSGFWFAFTVGRLLSILAATRFKPHQIIAVSLTFSLAFLGSGFIIPPSLSVLWVISAGLGFFMGPVWPSGYTLAGQSVRLTAWSSSIILLGDSIGAMILPSATGFLLERIGPSLMPQLVFGSLALTFISFFVILQLRKKIKI